MSFLKKSEELFRQAENEIKGKFKPNEFAVQASDLLAHSNIHKYFNHETISELLKYRKYPIHYYSQLQFSDVPLTLFRNEKFFLEIYFWKNKDTDIHDHHFTGAFKMLSGEQNQIELGFTEKKKISPFLSSGSLRVKKLRSMEPGDTQTILLGKDFIHQSLHSHTKITANICLRTPTIDGHDLSGYYFHGYKLKYLGSHDERLRKLSLIRLLPKTETYQHMASFLDTQSDHTLVTLAVGETLTHRVMDPRLRRLIVRYLAESRKILYEKTKDFIKGVPGHQKKHKKLKIFMYDTKNG